MQRTALTPVFMLLCLCLALLLFSPESHATSCPIGAPGTCLTGQGDWTTTLQERSFDGGVTIGGYFDSALNITWLADANYANTSGFDSDGFMTWSAANGWANTLDVNGITGWRLPTMTDTGTSGCNFSFAGGTDCGYNVQTGTSELAHMFYVTLGDKSFCPPGDGGCSGAPQSGWGLTNTGPFANLMDGFYWTDQVYALDPAVFAWVFRFTDGTQYIDSLYDQVTQFSWAVHDGDVGQPGVVPVPLPASVWSLLCGLLGMVAVSRRRQLPAAQRI